MSSPSDAGVPVRLTQAQRNLAAELLPTLADRLALDSRNQRTLFISVAEAKQLKAQAVAARPDAHNGARRNSLWHIAQAAEVGLERFQLQEAAAARQRLAYQFKITLLETRPTIWRRILAPDGTLDGLHEHIQTAMGWTNSHLHQFEIRGRIYGDPELLDDGFGDIEFVDSRQTRLSALLAGKRLLRKFRYTYDFGDGWEHAIEFEGVVPAEAGKKYPCCIDGKRACPPEDVGGVWGYPEFLEAIRNPKHEEHESYLEWIGGEFDPEAFSAVEASKAMRKGLPNWRDDR